MFPSPIGVLYISIQSGIYEIYIWRYVSVPYWGSLYFNVTVIKMYRALDDSFRPLLGFFIFQLC